MSLCHGRRQDIAESGEVPAARFRSKAFNLGGFFASLQESQSLIAASSSWTWQSEYRNSQ